MKRKQLVDKLQLVANALATDNMVPMFQCFVFHDETVTAYNDSLAIVTDCEVAESFAVNGQVLLGLLTNSHADDLAFTLESEDILVKAGKSTFRLPYFHKAEFLFSAPEAEDIPGCPLDVNLIDGLQACLLTSSTDNAQPALMGVCLRDGNLYSTNGDAVSRFTLGTLPSLRAMLPNAFCQALIKIYTETKATQGNLWITTEWVGAILGSGYSIYGRLLQVDRPLDYEAEIKKTVNGKAEPYAIPLTFNEALSRARVIADPESAKTVLTIEGDKLKLLTATHMGVVRDSVKIPFADTVKMPFVQGNVTANVSAQLLQRCIGLADLMYVRANCIEFSGRNNKLYILTSNMGD